LSEEYLRDLMLSVAHNADLKPTVLLALTTDARRMEVWSPKRKDIYLQNGFITFSQTKTGTIRSVPITAKLWNYYERERQELTLRLSSLQRNIHQFRLIFAHHLNPRLN
jgi:hypothetical protein